ncbi:hypothetical protein ACPOL_4669 [Acidisarcina polymorpha]|uniref:Porin n=1 Tax=Acidisarcina polymorpha TaxID=2211140 RepID=A0A2Z5G4I9_9BACT|nr:outer membrane beta-barrel protein [Acidisarcina polymorpha]AXC13939.1 hypothetical protein ACPOL_4669 [Acidisarcina polymorpha]
MRILEGVGSTLIVMLALTPLHSQEATLRPNESQAQLLERIERLEERIALLEGKAAPQTPALNLSVPDTLATMPTPPISPSIAGELSRAKDTVAIEPDASAIAPGEITFNFNFEGYYSFNSLHPANHQNTLRVYDSRSNTLSLSEVGVVIERTPEPERGARAGFRLDLLFGQLDDFPFARPMQNKNVLQAYGSYVAPVGKGLQVDFGQFFSPVGLESFYTADQIALSRGYILDLVPIYHVGLRTTYPMTKSLSVQYSLVNGINEGPEGKGLGSHVAAVALHHPTWMTQFNYYYGQPDFSTSSTGSSTGHPINQLGAKAQIANAYGAVTHGAYTLTSEFFFYTAKPSTDARALRATAGSVYLSHQISGRWIGALRFEHFNDAGGMISGSPRTLNGISAVATYVITHGFQTKLEYRHDWASTPVFQSGPLLVPSSNLDTATLGLNWRFGKKPAPW